MRPLSLSTRLVNSTSSVYEEERHFVTPHPQEEDRFRLPGRSRAVRELHPYRPIRRSSLIRGDSPRRSVGSKSDSPLVDAGRTPVLWGSGRSLTREWPGRPDSVPLGPSPHSATFRPPTRDEKSVVVQFQSSHSHRS